MRTSCTKAAKDTHCTKVWQIVLSLVPTCKKNSGCPMPLPCQHSSMIVTVLLFFPDLQPSPYSTNRSPPLSYNTVLLTRPARQPTVTFRDHMCIHTQSHTYMCVLHKYLHTYRHIYIAYYVHMAVHTYVYTLHMCTHLHICINIYIHTHIHTLHTMYVCTYIYTDVHYICTYITYVGTLHMHV